MESRCKSSQPLVADGLARRQYTAPGHRVSEYRISVVLGDVRLLNGHWYVIHAGLLRLAARKRCIEMRVAETRAVNRAPRKAYGIGLCSVEELGSYAPRHEEPSNGKPVHLRQPLTGQPD